MFLFAVIAFAMLFLILTPAAYFGAAADVADEENKERLEKIAEIAFGLPMLFFVMYTIYHGLQM